MDCNADTLKLNPMNQGVGRSLKHQMWPASRVKGLYLTLDTMSTDLGSESRSFETLSAWADAGVIEEPSASR